MPDLGCHPQLQFDVLVAAPFRTSLAAPRSRLLVRQTLLLSLRQRGLFNEEALPLITLPRTTEAPPPPPFIGRLSIT
jgi:hypothetical protein